MSRYLFFDTENANHFNGISKMCSLGYVLCDEKFNIIQSDDLIMNPESAFEREVINKILYYDKSYYTSRPNFKYYYDRIVKLFDNSIIIGHAVDNDINAINDACNRYDLPFINCTFYDTQRIYMEYKGLAKGNTPSLESIALELGIMQQGQKHRSKEDAYITMLGLQKLCQILSIGIMDALTRFNHVIGYNENGIMRLDREEAKNLNKINKHNSKIYYSFLNNCHKQGDMEETLKDVKISISSNYELNSFKEMLLIIQDIKNLGGIYVSKSTTSDIFVRYDKYDANNEICECKRLKAVEKEIAKGRNIKIITLPELFKMINYNEADIEPNYKRVINQESSKAINNTKENIKSESFTIGNVFADFFKDYKKS